MSHLRSMLSRRRFVASTGAVLTLGLPAWVRAATPELPVVAFVELDAMNDSVFVAAFREGLREHGYRDSVNVRVVVPEVGDSYERLTQAVAGLVIRKDVTVIATRGSTATTLVRGATQSLPIVMIAGIDPIKAGFAESLARPAKNLTGVSYGSQELAGKRLEFLREVVPDVTRVGVLVNPESRGSTASAEELDSAAKALKLELRVANIRTSEQIAQAFTQLANAKVDGICSTPSTMLFAHRREIVALAAKHRLPVIYESAEYVELGGLMAYGRDEIYGARRAADYVAKILEGSKPGDLPIEQPTKVELVLNVKTAASLGVRIPEAMLGRVDRVIR